MVKVRENYPVDTFGDVEISGWAENVSSIAQLNQASTLRLIGAAMHAKAAEQDALANDRRWSDYSSSFFTGLEMAHILAELHLDEDALVAAVLYRSAREGKISLREIRETYGESVTQLIEGVQQMAAIWSKQQDARDNAFGRDASAQMDNVRKMLVALVDDVRVALLKLAERTCAIRAVKEADQATKTRVSREVSEIYAPLAHRLGIGHIKWELEDLAFRYLRPLEYKNIARLLDEKRLDRQKYIQKIIKTLEIETKKHDIDAQIFGRAKHIYSIWRKMQRKSINFTEVYDIRAVRILVANTNTCFEVLGIVHSMWRPIPNEFDDYISAPKENGYRSLHTAVIGPDNNVLEVQIRSHEMNEEAEFGVCSHWRYKGVTGQSQDKGANSYDEKIEWLRQVLEWHEGLESSNALSDDIKQSIDQDRIYLFTPEGHIIDMPNGATPLDFAYRIHTQIGHRCRGVKVNGRSVPLNTTLNTADQVEIITGKQEVPSRDWLIDSLGYMKTSRARARVRQWFGEQARDQNISDGRALLDREFKRLGLLDIDLESLVNQMNLADLDALYACVGSGEVNVNQIIRVAQQQLHTGEQLQLQIVSDTPVSQENRIVGVGHLPTHIAACCQPLPGDEISGLIQTGDNDALYHAVIHRKDCEEFLQHQTDTPEQVIQVAWGEGASRKFEVDIIIRAYDRSGLLLDVARLLDTTNTNVTRLDSLSDKGQHTVDMSITVEISDFTQLSRILARLNQLPNVAEASRKV